MVITKHDVNKYVSDKGYRAFWDLYDYEYLHKLNIRDSNNKSVVAWNELPSLSFIMGGRNPHPNPHVDNLPDDIYNFVDKAIELLQQKEPK